MTSTATITANRASRFAPWLGRGMLLTTLALTAGCASTPTNLSNIREVDHLCEKDGGLRIHEKVYLPADRFHQAPRGNFMHGLIKNNGKLGEKGLGPEFRYMFEAKRIPASGGTGIQRIAIAVWRTSDGKLLGEAVNYSHTNGEATMPFVTVHSCPAFNDKQADEALMKAVFAPEATSAAPP